MIIRIGLSLFFSQLAACCLGQIRFEQGYFIDNDNQRTECFIQNQGWFNNPQGFRYKTNENAEVQERDLSNTIEFGVGRYQFKRADVKIDTAVQKLQDLGSSRHPEWAYKRLFLRTLVKGKATLFVYQSPDVIKFFFTTDSIQVEQLVYKLFRSQSNTINTNMMYVQQLFNHVNCGNPLIELKKIKYREDDLVRHFKRYNECKGEVATVVADSEFQQPIKWSLIVGVAATKMTFDDNFLVGRDITPYAPGRMGGLGIQGELVLPFGNGKWSMPVELLFQKSSYAAGTDQNEMNYFSVELKGGVRYSFYLKDVRFFLNGLLVLDKPLSYEVVRRNIEYSGSRLTASLSAGGGLVWRRWSAEMRNYFTRSTIDDTQTGFFDYSRVQLLVGYRLGSTNSGK